jgi:hypothetical protein
MPYAATFKNINELVAWPVRRPIKTAKIGVRPMTGFNCLHASQNHTREIAV